MSVSDRYSLNRRDKKLAGVCSTIGDVFNIDPTFVRIGFVVAAIFISWEMALVAYIGAGLYFHIQKRKAGRGIERRRDVFRVDAVEGGQVVDLEQRIVHGVLMSAGGGLFRRLNRVG